MFSDTEHRRKRHFMESSGPPPTPQSTSTRSMIRKEREKPGQYHRSTCTNDDDDDDDNDAFDRFKDNGKLQQAHELYNTKQKNSELDFSNTRSSGHGHSNHLRNGGSRHSGYSDDNDNRAGYARKVGRFKPPARLQESQGRRDLMAMAAASSHGDLYNSSHNKSKGTDESGHDNDTARKKSNVPSKNRNSRDRDEIDYESRRNHLHHIAISTSSRSPSRDIDFDEGDEDFDARLAANAAYEAAMKASDEYDNYLEDHEDGAFIINDRWDSGSSHHKNSQHNSVIRRSSSHDDEDEEEYDHDYSDRILDNHQIRQTPGRNGTNYYRGGGGTRNVPFPKEISTPTSVTYRSTQNNIMSADSVATPKSHGFFSSSGQSDAALMSTSHHTRFHHHQRSNTNDTALHSRKSHSNHQHHPQHVSDQELSNHDSHNHRKSAPRSPVRKKSVTPDDYANHYHQQQRQIELQQQLHNSKSPAPIRVVAGANIQPNYNGGSRESSYNRLSYNSRSSRDNGSSHFSGHQSSGHGSAASRRRLYAEQKSVPYTKVESTQLFLSPLPPSPPRRYASPNQRQRMNNEAIGGDIAVDPSSQKPLPVLVKDSNNNRSNHRVDISPKRVPKFGASKNIPIAPLLKESSYDTLTVPLPKFDLSKAPYPPSLTVEPPVPPSIPEDYSVDTRQYAPVQQQNRQKQQRRLSAGRALENNNSPRGPNQKLELDERLGPNPDYEKGIIKSDTDHVNDKKTIGQHSGGGGGSGGALDVSNTTISTANQQTETNLNEVVCLACSTRLLTSKTTIAVECPNCSFVSPATSVASTLYVNEAVGNGVGTKSGAAALGSSSSKKQSY